MSITTILTSLKNQFFPTTTEAALEPLQVLKKKAARNLDKVHAHHSKKAAAATVAISRDWQTIDALNARRDQHSSKATAAYNEASKASSAKALLTA